MQYLIANWKAELTYADAQEWVTLFARLLSENNSVTSAIQDKKLSIIVCPPYPFIPFVKDNLQNKGILIGSQDISSKERGKYTGEVTAHAMKDIIQYAIVGHSERRVHCNETDAQVFEKIMQCANNAIQPILCIRDTNDTLHAEAKIIAYEPVAAIGSGQNEDAAAVIEMKKKLMIPAATTFLYGGSVDRDNIRQYTQTGEIHGFLVGSASLHADHFFSLAQELL